MGDLKSEKSGESQGKHTIPRAAQTVFMQLSRSFHGFCLTGKPRGAQRHPPSEQAWKYSAAQM
ncbi:MAG TPA: hypothetical protein VGE56_06785, partial [Rhodocyclaceae bacterium]